MLVMPNKESFLYHISFVFISFALSCTTVLSQIIPDTTLGTEETSVVIPNQTIKDTPSTLINGGSVRGSNLFHSFQDFNINLGKGTYFADPAGISNILVRVTGGNPSKLNGTLGVLGSANLIFLNPHGISFGPNVRLDLSGSFLASTANNIQFSDGIQFSATNPQPVPLLTINVPIGLGFTTGYPGSISVEGTGHNLFFSGILGTPILGSGQSLTGLRTNTGETIALVGGQVNFDGGILTAPSGRIEVGSVTSGIVSLASTPTGLFIGYGGVQKFQNIQLNNRSLLDASGFSNGKIFLQARIVNLTNGSAILISNFGSLPSGGISINATEALELNGTITDNNNNSGESLAQRIAQGIGTQNFFTGKGADIFVSTNKLVIQNSAQLTTQTFGLGGGGNISLIVGDSNQNLGNRPSEVALRSGGVATLASGTGQAGNLTLSTQKLSIQYGATFASENFGSGAGGNVTINASDSVEISGAIRLTPNSFLQSFLGALTTSSGNAGNVVVNTRQLIVNKGGRLDSSTLASGSAGSININATDSINVSDRVPGSLNPNLISSISSSANVIDPYFTPIFGLYNQLNGATGSITINTNKLNVQNGAQISVRSDGIGNAGTLQIHANSINLNNQGSITASTASGEGGNIFLQSRNLQLRHNSPITANAGGTGNGGNININTRTLAALENSNISANAQGGTGGRVTINTQGLFLSQDSAIAATSEAGPQFSGRVQINTPDIDPSQGLVALPASLFDATGQIAQGCPAAVGSRASKFIVTGTGGIPLSPSDSLNSYAVWHDLPSSEVADNSMSPAKEQANGEPTQIVEARGWRQNPDGTITLTAEANTNGIPYSSLSTPSCYQPYKPRIPPSSNAAELND